MTDSQEIAVARMEGRVEAMAREVSQLVNSVRLLTETVNKSALETARIETVQVQVVALFRGQDDLWAEMQRITDKQEELQKERASSVSNIAWDLFKMLLAALTAAGAIKYGGRG